MYCDKVDSMTCGVESGCGDDTEVIERHAKQSGSGRRGAANQSSRSLTIPRRVLDSIISKSRVQVSHIWVVVNYIVFSFALCDVNAIAPTT